MEQLLTFVRNLNTTHAVYRCECGNIIPKRKSHVNTGHTRSCGHLKKEALELRNKHGHAINQLRSGTYRAWLAMRRRCRDPNYKHWHYYGGRGIRVCDRWNDLPNGFAYFLADMGEKPFGLTIDRINVNGNYEPGNCRWATMSQQQKNKRNSIAWKEQQKQYGTVRATV